MMQKKDTFNTAFKASAGLAGAVDEVRAPLIDVQTMWFSGIDVVCLYVR